MKTVPAILLLFSVLLRAEAAFDFGLALMDTAGKKTTLAPYQGKPLIVLYYSLECDKCKKAVAEATAFFDKRSGTGLIGVVTGSTKEEAFRKRKSGSAGFPVFYDKYRAFRDRYKLDQVPVTLYIERTGAVRLIKERFFEGNYRDVLEVYGAVLAGRDSAFLKGMQDRYYSAEVCQACHAPEFAHWKSTTHASAYDPIAKKFFRSGYREGFSADVDPACLTCHTLGYGEADGYDEVKHPKHLLGVQCESCHSAAGPHRGGRITDYESVCLRCHDTRQDPLFRYSEKLKKIKHPKAPN